MKLILLSISLIVSGCASIQEQCARPGISEQYGGYDHCVQAKEERKRSIQALFTNIPSSHQPASVKNVDYSCMNRCTNSGSMYGYCESKCGY